MLVLGRKGEARFLVPIAVGAVVPDLPMVVFYAYQRLLLGRSEALIWSKLYHAPVWQNFFDIFNSLPIVGACVVVAWRLNARWWMAFLLSMLLHSIADMLLHHSDAHRHFFPFTEWRFFSPVSYWDPRHFGDVVGTIEMILAFAIALLLVRLYPQTGSRMLIGCIAGIYCIYLVFVHLMWA